jgi:hypothetical protein
MKIARPCPPIGFTAGVALCWWAPERQGSFGSRCGSADHCRSGGAIRGPSRRTATQVLIHRRRRAKVHQSCCRPPAEAGDQIRGEPELFFGSEPDYRNQTGTSPVGQLSRPTGHQRGGTMLRGVCLRTSPSSNAHIAPMAKTHPRAAHVGSCAHACCSCGQIQITARMLSNPFRRRA